ncbi:MAG: repeat protein, partial [Patescibacteria group bacterium]|nr:repeat protein [Patescibacteria group bacterium]
AIGNTNATSVSVCNSAACDTYSLGTNTDADTITIGESNDSVSIASANWSITSGGAATFTSLTNSGLTTFTDDVDMTFVTDGAQSENLNIGVTHATDATLTPLVITFTDTAAADTGTNYLAALVNADDGGATGTPDGLFAIQSTDTNELVADGIIFDVAAGGLTTAINASDAQIDTALSIGANEISGTTGTINFTNFDVSSSGEILVAATQGIDTNAAGALRLGQSNATSVGICNSATCDAISLGATTDADSILIGESNDNIAITEADWSISTAGLFTTGDDIALNGGDLTSSSSTFNLLVTASTTVNAFDAATTLNINDAAVTSTIDIGGVTNSGTNTVQIATNSTAADTITIGNSNASTILALTGGDDWSMSGTGVLTLSASASQTTAVVISDTDYANAFSIGDNDISGTSFDIIGTTGTINLTNFDVASTGAITVAADVGLDTNAAGALHLGNTNATSVSLCNSIACDSVAIATNTDADTIAIGDSLDTFAVDAKSLHVNDDLTTETNIAVQSHGLTTGHIMSLASSGNALTSGDLVILTHSGTRTATGTISASDISIARSIANNSAGLLTISGDIFEISSENTNTSGTLTDTADLISLTQSNTTSSGNAINITHDGTGHAINIVSAGTGSALKILGTGDLGTTLDSSTGGLIHISDTANDDYSFTIYNNTGGTANTALSYILQDHIGFDQDVSVIQNDSQAATSSALVLTQNVVSDATTAATSQALVIKVNESANSEEVILILSDADGTPDAEFRFENDGDLFGDGAAYNSGADYAEFFYTLDSSLADHQMVCQDTLNDLAVKKCSLDDHNVIGVVSTSPGFVGNNIPGADGSLEGNPNYRIVGLEGQIETYVTAADGAIAIGDALTASDFTAGYAGKATEAGRIVGFALEPLASGTGVIKVRVNPGWHGGDVVDGSGNVNSFTTTLALESLATATANAPVSNSNSLAFRGSAWNGTSAQAIAMTLSNKVASANDYRLSVANNTGAEVAYINNLGDLVLSGKLYPSNQGTAQTSAYIYYDSNGVGYMRTNAAGWGTGSYDFAEMFPAPEVLAPGEVVVFGDDTEQVKRSTGKTYDDRIAGVVSTRPGFLAGTYKPGDSPIALSGRVPTKVNTENGTIAIGDPLTTSSTPGVAMKADTAGPIIGYAMQSFTGDAGMITVFIRASYYDGDGSAPALVEAPVSTVAENTNLTSLNLSGGPISSVSSITGLGNTWKLAENGDLITRGRVVQIVKSHQNEDVETYVAASRQMTVQLSGTTAFENNAAIVRFEDIDPQFNDIIGTTAPYRVLATPSGVTGQVYVTDRSQSGFTVHAENAANGVLVDWLVIAYQKDYEPVITPDPVTPDPEPEVDPVVPTEPEPEVAGVTVEEPVVVPEETPATEPVLEETVSLDPVVPPVTPDPAPIEPVAEVTP